MDIEISAPSINASGLRYEVVGPNRIVTGLLAVKGVGDGAIEHIIEHRPYRTFPEFIMKSTGTKGNRSPITKTVIDSLAKVGCFDVLGMTRKNALEHWPEIKTRVASTVKKAFKNNVEVDLSSIMEDFDTEDEYSKKQIMKNEMEVIGHYLTGSHNDIYAGFFKSTPDITPLADVGKTTSGQTIKIEAVIKVKIKELKISKKTSKSFGRAFAKYMLEDVNGKTAELTLWPDHYEKLRTIFADGTPIRALCEVNEYMDSKSLILRQVEDIPDVFVKGRMIKK
jgi:DNA polymerase-3 subunit alpha